VNTRVGTLVVRAWAEPGSDPQSLRARVLAISGPDSQTEELGVAAGMTAILDLVADGLRAVLPADDLDDGPVS
jgi:hypothetical protein